MLEQVVAGKLNKQIAAALDVSEHSAHWARAQRFLEVAAQVLAADGRLDAEARQRLAVERQIAHWQAHPPEEPVILAGSAFWPER